MTHLRTVRVKQEYWNYRNKFLSNIPRSKNFFFLISVFNFVSNAYVHITVHSTFSIVILVQEYSINIGYRISIISILICTETSGNENKRYVKEDFH